jgi:hypothetical protein
MMDKSLPPNVYTIGQCIREYFQARGRRLKPRKRRRAGAKHKRLPSESARAAFLRGLSHDQGRGYCGKGLAAIDVPTAKIGGFFEDFFGKQMRYT